VTRKSFTGAATPTTVVGSMTAGSPAVGGVFTLASATGWNFQATAQYARVDGTSGAYISTPDAAAHDIVGDIDVRVCFSLDDWTPAAINTVIAKYNTTSNQRSWRLYVDTVGLPRFASSPDGQSGTIVESTFNGFTVPADGTVVYLGMKLDVDNGASGKTWTWYTSTNGVDWTLAETDTAGTVTSIYSSTAVVELGAFGSGTGERMTGNIYWAEVRSGLDGTLVTSPRFAAGSTSTLSQATLTDAQTRVWTLNGNSLYVISSPFVTVVDRGLVAEEKILCNGIGGPTVRVAQRGYDDTVAASHNASANILHVLDSDTVDEANAAVEYGSALFWMGTSP
jgi:hypothetical protein